eukprot:357412-Chlamydomonas_euryale.AAC.8
MEACMVAHMRVVAQPCAEACKAHGYARPHTYGGHALAHGRAWVHGRERAMCGHACTCAWVCMDILERMGMCARA